MKLIQLAGDWWWPKLSPDGRFVAGGGTTVVPTLRMLDLASRSKADLGGGRAVHWFNDNTMTWINEDGPLRDARYVAKPFGIPQRTNDDPSLVAGNDFTAANGHWASWLAQGFRLAYDNKTIATGVRGCSMAGTFLLTATDSEFVVFMGGVEAKRFPIPPRANSWNISPNAIIGYGYYWPPHLLMPDGTDLDVTAAEWGDEGVPVFAAGSDGAAWIWTHTVRPGDEKSLVIGRPVYRQPPGPGKTPCIVIEDFPANTLDVVWVPDSHWVLVGADTDGTLHAHQVAWDEPRALVLDKRPPLPPPPVDPPPVDPPPPAPEEKKVNAQTLADHIAIPWDIYVHAMRSFQSQLWLRDRGADVPSAGALAYLEGNLTQTIAQAVVARDRLPGGTGSPEGDAADWIALADQGVRRAIAAYRRDQKPDPEDGVPPQ